MADTLQFDLVSPERKLASVAATAVTIPGIGGDFTAMRNHVAVPDHAQAGRGTRCRRVRNPGVRGHRRLRRGLREHRDHPPRSAVLRAEIDCGLVSDLLAAAERDLRRGPRGGAAWPPASASATW